MNELQREVKTTAMELRGAGYTPQQAFQVLQARTDAIVAKETDPARIEMARKTAQLVVDEVLRLEAEAPVINVNVTVPQQAGSVAEKKIQRDRMGNMVGMTETQRFIYDE